jgi:ATP-dependent Lon protease
MNFYKIFLAALPCLIVAFGASAQNQPQSPEQQEKQMTEYIDKEVQRLSGLLNLEYWQEFYVDSILNHDIRARQEELLGLQKARVENTDLYMAISDKWMEKIDDSFKRFFTPEQWEKYQKSGARRAQKERDKRKKK